MAEKEEVDGSPGSESCCRYLRNTLLKSWHLQIKLIWLTSEIMTSDTRLNIYKSRRSLLYFLQVANIWSGGGKDIFPKPKQTNKDCEDCERRAAGKLHTETHFRWIIDLSLKLMDIFLISKSIPTALGRSGSPLCFCFYNSYVLVGQTLRTFRLSTSILYFCTLI